MTNPKKTLKLGFLGGGVNSAVGYTHFSASKMDGRWELVAGCFSRNETINAETASLYGISEDRVYQSLEEMLKSEKNKVDAIAILTPTPEHYNAVIQCLEAGFPVICEKTFAINSYEAIRMTELCEEKKGFLAVTYNYTGYPMLRELREIIRSNRLGKILHFQAEMPQEGFIRVDSYGNKPSPQGWRLKDSEVPTIYLDLCSHLHQIIYYLIESKPLKVIADQNSEGWFRNIVDNVQCLARYGIEGDIQGNLWFSKSSLGQRNGLKIRIYGSEASAEWQQIYPEELSISYSNGKREIIDRASNVEVCNLQRYTRFKAGHPAGFLEAFANLYTDIADSIIQYKLTGTWSSSEVYGGKFATEGLLFLEAMAQSIKTEKWEYVHYNRSY